MHSEPLGKWLLPNFRVVLAPNRKTLLKTLPSADALITLVTDKVDLTLLRHAPRLKVLGNFGVGTDNVDLKLCKKRGVRVVNTPGVLTRSTAELALALTLAAARRFHEAHQTILKQNPWRWAPDFLLGQELKGRTSVLVGQGRIGSETARLFRAIGMRCIFITRRDSLASIEKKLKSAQVLSMHLPLTKDTRHWLNRKRIALLRKDCIVVNSARGGVVDERALYSALKKKSIFAAGLDVAENEPNFSRKLAKQKNVFLLPHVGSATHRARQAMAELVCRGVAEIFSGKRPFNQVV